MGKNTLSKTTYIKGLQCLKYLYLYKKHYNLQDKLSAKKLAIFKRGHNVGDLAQELFPGGVNLKPASHFQYHKALQATQYHIEKNTPVIYEAAFNYNDVLIFLDVLVNINGSYHAYEVKSSLSVSETYLEDAALQYHVICGAGVEPDDMSIITVNEDYILKGSLDIHAYFKIVSVSDIVKDRQNKVAAHIARQKQVLLQSTVPDIAVGSHCFIPYECDFKGYCWKHILNDNSIFSLDFLSLDEKLKLLESGNMDISSLLSSGNLNTLERVKVGCLLEKKKYVDKDRLEKFLLQIAPDYCLLEIFFLQPAIPLFENNRPYEIFPYTASLYGSNGHHYHVCNNAYDDRKALIDFVMGLQNQFSSVLVYDKQNLYELLTRTAQSINYNETEIEAFFEKVTGLRDVLKEGIFWSYKIKSHNDKDELLHDLGLKNPFPKKGKPNNIYDAAALYEHYVETGKNSYRDELINYALDSNNYLMRLLEFYKKTCNK